MHQPGIEVRPITQVDGSAEFNEVFFNDARCPKDDVVGGVGNGWKVANTTLGFERGSSATTSYRRFLKEWERVVDDARANGKDADPLIRDRLVRSWIDTKIMQVNGWRTLTDSLHGTRNAALLSACNKMFWSESHRRTMELAVDVLGMRAQILEGTGSAEGLLPVTDADGTTTRSPTCRRASSSAGQRRSGAGPPRSSATWSASAASGCRRSRPPPSPDGHYPVVAGSTTSVCRGSRTTRPRNPVASRVDAAPTPSATRGLVAAAIADTASAPIGVVPRKPMA